MKPADEQRFWSKVDKSGDCWIWSGTVVNGQCVISIDGKPQYAVRVAWELENGPPPARTDLRRTCGSPLCIRPDHRVLNKALPKPVKKPRPVLPFADISIETGTYYILNLVNHRIYVGTTGNLQQRFRLHLGSLNHGQHHNASLQDDWNTYGVDAFEFGILVMNTPRWDDGSETFEDTFVRIYQSDNPLYGYNLNHFDRSKLSEQYTASIRALAAHWGLTNRRYHEEVLRRCVDYTYQNLLGKD